MGIKDLFLQKGWAGRTISRSETIEHINPIIRVMNDTMQWWGAAAETANGETANQARAALKTLRMDIGKLAETVFSCGGVAYNGTELEPSSYQFATDGWNAVLKAEQAVSDILSPQQKVEHHMRTRAILAAVAANHEARLELIRTLSR